MTAAGCDVWWQLTCRWFQGLCSGALSGFRWRRQRLEFVSLRLVSRQDNHSVAHQLILQKPASQQTLFTVAVIHNDCTETDDRH